MRLSVALLTLAAFAQEIDKDSIRLPAGPGPFPTILNLTQSPLDDYLQAGYAVVQPGRPVNGYDTVESIARQPWSNGKIGILAGQGSALAAYRTLQSGSPHLSAGAIHDAHAAPGLAPDNSAPFNAPILHYTGWFDSFSQGTIDAFLQAQKDGAGKARFNQKLIVHARDPEAPPFDSLARRWFDYWLRDIDTRVHKLPAVQYRVLAGPWRSIAGWPPVAASQDFFLQPGGGLSRSAPAPVSSSTSFDYDPANPVPSLDGDQRPLNARSDILRFNSLPLTAPLEIGGPLQAELFVSTTAKETDFLVRLIDIRPDGFETLMAAHSAQLIPTRKNKVHKLTVDLWSLAMVFPKGHRIAVQITSSASPASNTVHHATRYPSRLLLPVIQPPK